MKIPCANCPWRKSTRTADIPGGGLDAVRSDRLLADDFTVMACHLPAQEHPACAGFVARVGTESIGVRLAIVYEVLDLADYGDGGLDLHADVPSMLAAHRTR